MPVSNNNTKSRKKSEAALVTRSRSESAAVLPSAPTICQSRSQCPKDVTLQPGKGIPPLAARIYERLLKQHEAELDAAAPKGPQTILDLLEDAPEREKPQATADDIARLRMDSLRLACKEAQQDEANQDTFRVLSWNIDSLDERDDARPRLVAVAEMIVVLRPAVVCLQEVDVRALALLRCALEEHYHVVMPTPRVYEYFVAIFVSRVQVQAVHTSRTVSFSNSGTGRQLLLVGTTLHDGRSAEFLTSHLESSQEGFEERQAQFRTVCEFVSKSSAQIAMVAGDMNLRNFEATAILGKFDKIVDAWEHLGSDSAEEFTWDTQSNDNCGIAGPRCRYDRLYFKAGCVAPLSFKLIGRNRLPDGQFASDHWALVTCWPLPTAPLRPATKHTFADHTEETAQPRKRIFRRPSKSL